MVEREDYGVVRVTKGPHKGRVGYYDNDSDDGRRAIVYFDTPFDTPYVLIRHSCLEPSDVPHLGLQRLETSLPHVAEQLGTFYDRRARHHAAPTTTRPHIKPQHASSPRRPSANRGPARLLPRRRPDVG
jgi:hypothetical protein